ncbi:MAG: hypothetical protein ACI8QI_001490 [Limisphaerales bacterium]|jgi:hypothetical protein
MNKQEAKFILQAYRPGSEDAADPQFAEALEVARQTPELTRWLDEETALDEALGRKLQDTPIPADLKEKILVGRKLIQATPWWRQRAWLAAAASVALLLGLLVSLQSPAIPGQEFADYRHSMIEFAQHRMDGLDYKSEAIPDIRQWLASRSAHGGFVAPASLAGLLAKGCRLLQWNDQQVALICFSTDAGLVHLYVLDQDEMRGVPSSEQPVVRTLGDWQTTGWSQGGKVYLAASRGNSKLMRNLL